MSTIGQRIRTARERAVLSQDELATKAGLSRTSLSQIESGRTQPRPSTIRRIAEALELPASSLVSAGDGD